MIRAPGHEQTAGLETTRPEIVKEVPEQVLVALAVGFQGTLAWSTSTLLLC